jgi:hypothetical protein
MRAPLNARDAHLLALADREARSAARVIGRKIERGVDLGECEALFGVRIEHSTARLFELDLRSRLAELELGHFRELTFRKDAIALEGEIVEIRAGTELDRHVEQGRRLAADALFRIGQAQER